MLTLKRVVICLGLFGCVSLLAVYIAGSRREKVASQCFENLHNYHEVLALYRADNDGHAPSYDIRIVARSGARKLEKYAAGKPIACPWAPGLFGAIGRVMMGSKSGGILTPFGVEDTSIEFICEQHLSFKQRLAYMGFHIPLTNDGPPRGGFYPVLLRNGTAKAVSFDAKREHWIAHDGEFKRIEDRPTSWKSYGHVDLFGFEPKPPQFEY